MRVAAVVLAAGCSRRFGRRNKLLATLHGRPLWWQALRAAFASRARPVIVVLGRRPQAMLRSLARFRKHARRNPRLRIVINRNSARGMSTSVRAGIAAVPTQCAGALICLGDMPEIRSRLIACLIAAYRPGDTAVVPTLRGQRGNPVLISREIFGAMAALRGDEGARRILARTGNLRLLEVESAANHDIDTRRDLRCARRRPSSALS